MSIVFFADSDNESYDSSEEEEQERVAETENRAQNCRTGIFSHKIRRRMQQMFF